MKYGKMMTFTALSIGLLAGCGKNPVNLSAGNENGIVHGEDVKKSDNLGKSVVALILERPEGKALCTATIIDKDTVLTAAHCVDDITKVSILFTPNIDEATEANLRVGVAYKQNPAWKMTNHDAGDLALIRFDGGLPQGFAPAVLADKSLDLKTGTEVTMIGFGVNEAADNEGAGILRETTTKIIGNHTPTEIMTDGQKSSVCFGDSGGPAFAKDGSKMVQWGVASAVTNEECNQASIHTSIITYRAWISSAMTELRKATPAAPEKTAPQPPKEPKKPKKEKKK